MSRSVREWPIHVYSFTKPDFSKRQHQCFERPPWRLHSVPMLTGASSYLCQSTHRAGHKSSWSHYKVWFPGSIAGATGVNPNPNPKECLLCFAH